jgi:hypothetical protein
MDTWEWVCGATDALAAEDRQGVVVGILIAGFLGAFLVFLL